VLPSLALSAFTWGAGAPALLGTFASAGFTGASAGGNAYKYALSQGYDQDSARNYAILAGFSEGGLQFTLGGIPGISSNALGSLLKTSIGNIDNALLRVAANVGVRMAEEGFEEAIQTVLEPAYKNLMLGEENKLRLVSSDAAYSFLLGAVTAGLLSAPGAVIGEISNTRLGRSVLESDHTADLVQAALGMKPKKDSFKLASLLDSGKAKLNAANLGELMRAYKNDGGDLSFMQVVKEETLAKGQEGGISRRSLNAERNASLETYRSEAEREFRAAGMEEGEAARMAELSARQLAGEGLTVFEERALTKSREAVRYILQKSKDRRANPGISVKTDTGNSSNVLKYPRGAGEVLVNANFAQKTYSLRFSVEGQRIYSNIAGVPIKTVDDLATALEKGLITPSDVPIDYIIRDGNVLILNTRSAHALLKARIPRNLWNAVNRTSVVLFESMLDGQLKNNGLTSTGTPTAKMTGGH